MLSEQQLGLDLEVPQAALLGERRNASSTSYQASEREARLLQIGFDRAEHLVLRLHQARPGLDDGLRTERFPACGNITGSCKGIKLISSLRNRCICIYIDATALISTKIARASRFERESGASLLPGRRMQLASRRPASIDSARRKKGSSKTMSSSLLLVSHKLCPYVQRAVISLTEKGKFLSSASTSIFPTSPIGSRRSRLSARRRCSRSAPPPFSNPPLSSNISRRPSKSRCIRRIR